jgi:hypothetical protein
LSDTRVRTLLELRRELEEELEELKDRVQRLEAYVKALDSTIGASSFSTADAALSPAESEASKATEEAPSGGPRTIEIKHKSEDLELATMQVTDDEIAVTPAPHALYDIKRGAFARFFVERILGGFQQEDKRRVENGEIKWEDSFDFDIQAEDSVLQGIFIRNYGGEERLEEIRNALRWALEKTYRPR